VSILISPSSTCSADTGADVPIPILPEADKIVNLSLPPAQNLNLSESNLAVTRAVVGCSIEIPIPAD
jgi:hypothetical protein